MPEHTTAARAVFLSYAREDAGSVRRIADALRAFGVEVWFDMNELRGGDAWDAKIRTQIRTCTLCVPVISAATQSRGEGYFRREWKIAVERTHDMAAGVPFLLPVVIDDTAESDALVPDEFMRVQWTRLPKGVPTSQFVEQVKKLLEGKAGETGRSRPPMHPESPAPAVKRGLPGWTWGALTAVLVGIAAALVVSRKPAPVAAPPAPVAAEAKPAAAPVAPKVSDKSIAVLPFTNMSEEKDASAFFADGIHEDILTNLALVRELRVVSRTSVMQYRATTKTIRQIAQELGVAYILEGSVRRAGNKVRITGQLIHATSDEHVWAQAYDRDLTDVFTIQAELSQQIAAALKAALSPEEKALLVRRPTENLAAYDAYVKARQLRNGGSGTNLDAEPVLLKAVALDPNFAQAWAELGSLHAQIYFNEIDHSAERLAKARAAIDTAVRLAPDAPEVIEKRGDYLYYGYRDFTGATEQYQRLAVMRPNDAAVFGSLGFIHRRQGRWGEALAELRRAVQLEPRNLRYARTLTQLAQGLNLYDEATAVQQQIVAQYPEQLAEASLLMIIPVLARGSLHESQAWLAQLKPGPKDQALATYLRLLWARGSGDLETAIRLDQEQPYYDGFGEPRWTQDVTAASLLWLHGDKTAARLRAEQAVAGGKAELAQKPASQSWAAIAGAYVILGDKTEALRCAQIAKDLVPESADAVAGPPLSVNFAQILAWCGEKDRAIAEFARLLRTPFGENIHTARVNPGWFPLRGDPRFEALLNDPKNNAPLF